MKPTILLYKNKGETPLECLERFRVSNPVYRDVVMTYAGRLDPMAEGLLLVLTGEECKHKEKYLGLTKTYEFEILWGFETDTGDVLGLVSGQNSRIPERTEITKVTPNFLGTQTQTYPAYSSKTVQGKALFVWAREGKIQDVLIPKRSMEIFSLVENGERTISGQDMQKQIFENISRVQGDFRQQEIILRWQKVIDVGRVYTISSFKVECSSGTYVRTLVNDMAHSLATCGVAYSIKRTAVGDYEMRDGEVDNLSNLS